MSPFSLDRLAVPVVQAPLAGGPSNPALAAAVSGAGGFGFLATGYRSPDELRAQIAELRAGCPEAFGVNLFVPGPDRADASEVARFADRLAPEADRYGVRLGEALHDDDGFGEKVEVLCADPPAVVSFTFGCPPPDVVESLHRAGAAVWITVTTAEEALRAADAGADALVVQGVEAGGHRGGLDESVPGDLGLLALLQVLRERVEVPLVATGGIATGAAVAAVLVAGARAAQLGTAFMRCPEAGTSDAHKAALASERPTDLTRAFTGRTARGIVNRFMREHGADAPLAYPEVNHLTAPVRAAARAAGDAEGFHLWAGQAHPLARELPAAELVEALWEEARAALADAVSRARR